MGRTARTGLSLWSLALVALLVILTDTASARRSKKVAPPAKDKKDAAATPDAHVPSAQSVEIHHSLHRPLDQSQVYWNFGGSTVLTKNHIRLTPAAQDRKGWLWNDYPIESDNWEVEFQMEVFSKPHFGGDGMAFWLLDGAQDPTFHNDPSFLNGDVFGVKRDFKGVGVAFDIYDNDGKRDNPLVFILYNPEGKETNYNHDNDYADDMYKEVSPGSNAAYSCVANVRNTDTPTKIMVKFLRKILHVYVDTFDGLGYKFCLAVKFDKPFRDHHIAFTGMTGQVADAHDVLEVSTKYLEETDSVNDDYMLALNNTGSCASGRFLFWSVLCVVGLLLTGLAGKEYTTFRQLQAAEINPVHVCTKMNTTLMAHYGLHAVVCAALLFGWQLKYLLLQVPLLLHRVYQLSKGKLHITPVDIGGSKVHGGGPVSLSTVLLMSLIIHGASVCLYMYSWVQCS